MIFMFETILLHFDDISKDRFTILFRTIHIHFLFCSTWTFKVCIVQDYLDVSQMVLRTFGPLTNHFSTIFKTLLEPFVQCDGSPYSLKCYKFFPHISHESWCYYRKTMLEKYCKRRTQTKQWHCFFNPDFLNNLLHLHW